MAKCNKCNIKLEDDTFDVCPTCERKGRTKNYFYAGIVLLIIGLILGIILGVVYPATIKTDSILENSKKVFNFMLMFECWGTCLLLSTIPFGLNSICHRLDLIIDNNKNGIK